MDLKAKNFENYKLYLDYVQRCDFESTIKNQIRDLFKTENEVGKIGKDLINDVVKRDIVFLVYERYLNIESRFIIKHLSDKFQELEKSYEVVKLKGVLKLSLFDILDEDSWKVVSRETEISPYDETGIKDEFSLSFFCKKTNIPEEIKISQKDIFNNVAFKFLEYILPKKIDITLSDIFIDTTEFKDKFENQINFEEDKKLILFETELYKLFEKYANYTKFSWSNKIFFIPGTKKMKETISPFHKELDFRKLKFKFFKNENKANLSYQDLLDFVNKKCYYLYFSFVYNGKETTVSFPLFRYFSKKEYKEFVSEIRHIPQGKIKLFLKKEEYNTEFINKRLQNNFYSLIRQELSEKWNNKNYFQRNGLLNILRLIPEKDSKGKVIPKFKKKEDILAEKRPLLNFEAVSFTQAKNVKYETKTNPIELFWILKYPWEN